MLNAFGAERFYGEIRATSVDPKMPEGQQPGSKKGLAGWGVNLRDVTALYASLARKGEMSRIKLVNHPSNDKIATKNYHLLSEDSAIELSTILSKAPSIQGRLPGHLTKNSSAIAFKTGTSYGARDNWAFGYNHEFTIGVWVGRPDGSAIAGGTGRKFALPLLFTLFDRLSHSAENVKNEKEKQHASASTRPASDLMKLSASAVTPAILFPPNGATLSLHSEDSEGYVLKSNLRKANVKWYVNGRAIAFDSQAKRHFFRPDKPGFYELRAYTPSGSMARAQIEIIE